eukprot:2370741-Rhodomonas_salina.1
MDSRIPGTGYPGTRVPWAPPVLGTRVEVPGLHTKKIPALLQVVQLQPNPTTQAPTDFLLKSYPGTSGTTTRCRGRISFSTSSLWTAV